MKVKCANRMAFPLALTVNILAGGIFGTALGYIPTYIAFHSLNEDCEQYMSQPTCDGAVHAACVWVPAVSFTSHDMSHDNQTVEQNASGEFAPNISVSDFSSSPQQPKYECVHLYTTLTSVKCSHFNESAKCQNEGDDDVCVWSNERGCEFSKGFKAWEAGLFAGILLLGGVFGPYLQMLLQIFFTKKHKTNGTPVPRFRPVMITLGVLALVGNSITTLSRVMNSYGLLIAGRFIFGAVSGAVQAVAPNYAFLITTPARAALCVATVQGSISIGSLLMTLYAFFAQPDDEAFSHPTSSLGLESSIHLLMLPSWIAVFFYVIVGFFALEIEDIDFCIEHNGSVQSEIQVESQSANAARTNQYEIELGDELDPAALHKTNVPPCVPDEHMKTEQTGHEAQRDHINVSSQDKDPHTSKNHVFLGRSFDDFNNDRGYKNECNTSCRQQSATIASDSAAAILNDAVSNEHQKPCSDNTSQQVECLIQPTEITASIPATVRHQFKALTIGFFTVVTFMWTGLPPVLAFGPIFGEVLVGIDPIRVSLYVTVATAITGVAGPFIRRGCAIFVGETAAATPNDQLNDIGITDQSTSIADHPQLTSKGCYRTKIYGKVSGARVIFLIGCALTLLGDAMVTVAASPVLGMSDSIRHIVCTFGFLLLLTGANGFMGTAFYELIIQLFPKQYQGASSTILVSLLMLVNGAINVLFPLMVKSFAGNQGDELRGLSTTFGVMLGVGCLGSVVSFFFLHPIMSL